MSGVPTQRILVAPLDWGLGHATRCAPLIDGWLNEGHEVLIASNGRSAAWLKQRYPQLEVLTDIPDYAVTYPSNGSMVLHFAMQWPRLMRVARAENRWLKQLASERRIDHVYSDNRYGLFHEHVPCTLITHQLYVQVPRWSKMPVYGILNRYCKRFQSIWVPDYKGGNTLSGALSHGGNWDGKVRYIGPLSRLALDFARAPGLEVPDRSRGPVILALVSGPEPSRTAFEHQLRHLLIEMGETALLVVGTPDSERHEVQSNLTIINHLPDEQLAQAIEQAQLIICRAGYSTLMDLHVMKKRALLVPTPGQTEQEYLAEYHAKQGTHEASCQDKLTVEVLREYLQRAMP